MRVAESQPSFDIEKIFLTKSLKKRPTFLFVKSLQKFPVKFPFCPIFHVPLYCNPKSNPTCAVPQSLKVRQLRHEQHIRHLSKELDVTKSALEQERKLRSLQMDAIKVLWKEVQLMDVHQHAGGPRSGPRTIPSGQVSRCFGDHGINSLQRF